MHEAHTAYMDRALGLAQLGLGHVSPNPMVGAVLVAEGKVIGEGYHRKFGGPHAEVEAVRAVRDSALLAKSTLYVTLEPCCHYGKTPPCTELIIKNKIPSVVIACTDPNPLVAGKGIAALERAGVEVLVGVRNAEATWLNRRFITAMLKKRPYVVLKWAMTADGYMAKSNGDSKWISQPLSRLWVHKWRSEEDGIMVGSGTAQTDNPQLNVRGWTGRNPTRIVIDPDCELPDQLAIFDRTQPTICFNRRKAAQADNLHYIQLAANMPLADMLAQLHAAHVHSVLVEGGPATLGHFIQAGLWDEARVFSGKKQFGSGLAAPPLPGKLLRRQQILNDTYYLCLNPNAVFSTQAVPNLNGT